jgi:hypothetical protein
MSGRRGKRRRSGGVVRYVESDSGSDWSGEGGGDGSTKTPLTPAKRRAAASSSVKGGHGGGAASGAGAGMGPATESDLALVTRLTRETVTALRGRRKGKTLKELGYEGVREVSELGPEEVRRHVEEIVVRAATSILNGEGFGFDVPTRANSNQLYIAELDRIVLKDKVTHRAFVNAGTVRKTTIMTRVLELVHEVLGKNIHTTKRDLFYTDVKLFQSQDESDAVLDDVACLVGCTRTSLHVVASEKGVVVGRIRFKEDGDDIDCARMGVGGKVSSVVASA